jgi:hypothetical protein
VERRRLELYLTRRADRQWPAHSIVQSLLAERSVDHFGRNHLVFIARAQGMGRTLGV